MVAVEKVGVDALWYEDVEEERDIRGDGYDGVSDSGG